MSQTDYCTDNGGFASRSHTEVVTRDLSIWGVFRGAFIAVQLGLERSEVRAVSEISGGLSIKKPMRDRVPNRIFSMLITHGSKDEIVPVTEADRLERYCRQQGFEVLKHIYDGAGHYLPSAVIDQCIDSTIILFNQDYKTH